MAAAQILLEIQMCSLCEQKWVWVPFLNLNFGGVNSEFHFKKNKLSRYFLLGKFKSFRRIHREATRFRYVIGSLTLILIRLFSQRQLFFLYSIR